MLNATVRRNSFVTVNASLKDASRAGRLMLLFNFEFMAEQVKYIHNFYLGELDGKVLGIYCNGFYFGQIGAVIFKLRCSSIPVFSLIYLSEGKFKFSKL